MQEDSQKDIEQGITSLIQKGVLSIGSKNMILLSFFLGGLAAVFIEVNVDLYRQLFEGMGAKLPWLTAFNLKWHPIVAAVAFIPQLLVYFRFRHDEKHRQNMGFTMIMVTIISLLALIFYWIASMSIIFSHTVVG